MLLAKTIRCEVLKPTKTKLDLLNNEWDKYQQFIQLESHGLDWVADEIDIYSMYKSQARWYWNKYSKSNFPMSINNQVLKIKQATTKLSEFWARVPVKGKRGGIWLAFKPHKPFPKDYKLGESKLFKKKGKFYIHIVVRKEVKIKTHYNNVLAIDLGERVTATVLHDGKPMFMGRQIRGIRRHYSWLRKRLGNKKLLKKIKQLGHTEQDKIDQILHDISNEIVSLCRQHGLVISLGDLKGIRKSAKGRRMNRIVSNMPYYKLTQYITYKANWEGIKVIKISEHGTSHTCSRCGSKGKRPYQGLFKCSSCGYRVNADFNGVKNIHKRSLEQASKDGVLLMPIRVLKTQT